MGCQALFLSHGLVARATAMQHQLIEPTFESWRAAARPLLERHVVPTDVLWTDARDGNGTLDFATPATPPTASVATGLRIPRDFLDQAELAACYRDPERWALLYRLAYRLTSDEPHLMSIAVDDDVVRLRDMAKAVRRDNHKMHAFVRFKRVETDGREHYVAFHRPDHFIVRLTASFFVERFRVMDWTILTPDESVSWIGRKLRFSPGVSSREAPTDDAVEDLWLTYYRSIFNPARLKVKHMKQELPVRHWKTLPEAALIPELIAGAKKSCDSMESAAVKRADEVVKVPHSRSLKVIKKAGQSCLVCPWACHATQPVFGSGPEDAKIVLIGEQPGDQEDRAGKPFVGPAGQLLREVIEQAGFDADAIYFTNAVKHFKFEPRGTRRIHQTPNARDVSACRPWLEAELTALQPKVMVCLGATAGKSVFGNTFKITANRGQVMTSEWCKTTIPTYHPSAILRVPDRSAADEMREMLSQDLRHAFKLLRAA